MKNLSLKNLLASMTWILVLTTFTSSVFAAPPGQSVNSIQVTGLGNQLGRYMTALYAVGRPGIISNQRDQMVLRVIKWKKTLPITSDSVTFPATPVLPWNGNQMPYNMVVFAIHSSPDLSWINADGTLPEGARVGEPTLPLYVDSLRDTQINEMRKDSPEATLVYLFNFNY